MTIDLGQLVLAGAGAIAAQIGVTVYAMNAFMAKATERQEYVIQRLGRIEKAVGIDNPDEVAFFRRTEAKAHDEANRAEHDRLWKSIDEFSAEVTRMKVVLAERRRNGVGDH